MEKLNEIKDQLIAIRPKRQQKKNISDLSQLSLSTGDTSVVDLNYSTENTSQLLKLFEEMKQTIREIMTKQSQSDDEDDDDDDDIPDDREKKNGHDALLQDLLSLFIYIAVKSGKVTDTLYSAYTSSAKILSKLQGCDRSGVYTTETLEPLETQLSQLSTRSKTWKTLKSDASDDEAQFCYHLIAITMDSLVTCEYMLQNLKSKLELISPSLSRVHARLVELKLQLEALVNDSNMPAAFLLAEVANIQEELLEIDNFRIDGAFVSHEDEIVQGNGVVIELIELCYEDVHYLMAAKEEEVGEENPLREIYEKLNLFKSKLERLNLTGQWFASNIGSSKLEKELLPIQMELGKIDNLRKDGKFLDSKGAIPPGQGHLHFLLHKCYRIVHQVQSKAEGATVNVHADLMPLFSQLTTLGNCLRELVKWKVVLSSRELVPYQMKMKAIDSLRVDGKFMSGSRVPEGQGILHDLLAKNFDYLETLKNRSID